MPGSANKHKARQGSKKKSYYERQYTRTSVNKARRAARVRRRRVYWQLHPRKWTIRQPTPTPTVGLPIQEIPCVN